MAVSLQLNFAGLFTAEQSLTHVVSLYYVNVHSPFHSIFWGSAFISEMHEDHQW